MGRKGQSLGLHMAVEDRSGDSAIFEIIQGKVHTYHDRSSKYTVMTNDPPLPEQLGNLKRYKVFGGQLSLPGDVLSTDRFVRLSYYLQHMPKVQDTEVMAGNLRSILMNAAVPQGAPYMDAFSAGVYPTWWASIVDFSAGYYYWGYTPNSGLVWVDLHALASKGMFNESSKTRLLNPRVKSLAGDVTDKFSSLPFV